MQVLHPICCGMDGHPTQLTASLRRIRDDGHVTTELRDGGTTYGAPVLPSGRVLTSRRHVGRWVAIQAWRAYLWYLLSPKIVSRRGKAVAEISASYCGAALPSSLPAAVIKTVMRSPNVSTKIWRLRPFTRLPPSSPRSGPPLSVVLTDCLSMQTALGVGSRPAATRGCSRNAVTTLPQVPSSCHWAK
jgi:hypothetical protein